MSEFVEHTTINTVTSASLALHERNDIKKIVPESDASDPYLAIKLALCDTLSQESDEVFDLVRPAVLRHPDDDPNYTVPVGLHDTIYDAMDLAVTTSDGVIDEQAARHFLQSIGILGSFVIEPLPSAEHIQGPYSTEDTPLWDVA